MAPSRPGVSGLGFGFLFQLNSHRLIKSLIKTRQVGAWAGEATESEVSWRCVLWGLCWGLHHCGRREGRCVRIQSDGHWNIDFWDTLQIQDHVAFLQWLFQRK